MGSRSGPGPHGRKVKYVLGARLAWRTEEGKSRNKPKSGDGAGRGDEGRKKERKCNGKLTVAYEKNVGNLPSESQKNQEKNKKAQRHYRVLMYQ